MSDLNDEISKQIGTLELHLKAKAEKTAITLDEYIQTLRLSGVADSEIRKQLTDDLAYGGRIFGEFFNGLGVDISGGLGNMSRSAFMAKDGYQEEDELAWVCVSISEGDKACPDCEPRHMQVDTLDGWKMSGLPGSGWSVCRSHCKCVLMRPSHIEGEQSLTGPVKVPGLK